MYVKSAEDDNTPLPHDLSTKLSNFLFYADDKKNTFQTVIFIPFCQKVYLSKSATLGLSTTKEPKKKQVTIKQYDMMKKRKGGNVS